MSSNLDLLCDTVAIQDDDEDDLSIADDITMSRSNRQFNVPEFSFDSDDEEDDTDTSDVATPTPKPSTPKEKKNTGNSQAKGADAVYAKTPREFFLQNKDTKMLMAMAIGMADVKSYEHEVFTTCPEYTRGFKVTLKEMREEIVRRCVRHNHPKRKRPSQWKRQDCINYLLQHPITKDEHPEDYKWIAGRILDLEVHATSITQSEKSSTQQTMEKSTSRWCTHVPFLRFYHTLFEDAIREEFLVAHNSLNRPELDACNTDQAVLSFYEAAAVKFNDRSWIPQSLSLPQLHEDFAKSQDLPNTVGETTAEFLKKTNRCSKQTFAYQVTLGAEWLWRWDDER